MVGWDCLQRSDGSAVVNDERKGGMDVRCLIMTLDRCAVIS